MALTIERKAELKVELLQKTTLALREAKAQGIKQYKKIEDSIEDLFMTSIGMEYEVARQYIDTAKKYVK